MSKKLCVALVCVFCTVEVWSAESVPPVARKVGPDAVTPISVAVSPQKAAGASRPQDPALPYDPLRPPANLQANREVAGSEKEPPLQLESVQTTGARQVAVINGQRVMPGQSVRDYRVVSLDNRQAILQGPQGRLVLWLVPALHGQRAAANADTATKESAGVGEKTAPSIGERK